MKTVTIPDVVKVGEREILLVKSDDTVRTLKVGERGWTTASVLHVDEERELYIDRRAKLMGRGDDRPEQLNMPYVSMIRTDDGRWVVELKSDQAHENKAFGGFILEKNLDVSEKRWGIVSSFSVNGELVRQA